MADGPWVISLVGLHDSGKTTVGEALVRGFAQSGLCIAVVKHEGHHADDEISSRHDAVPGWEKPGSDTRRYAAAGAAATVLAGRGETLWRMMNDPDPDSPTVLIQRLIGWCREAGSKLDGVVIEGFKRSTLPKIAVLRDSDSVGWLRESSLTNLVAIVVNTEGSNRIGDWDYFQPIRHFVGFEGIPIYSMTELDTLCQSLIGRLNRRFI